MDNVLGDDLICAWGDEYIEDVVHGCACRVLPGSFMQANGVLVNRLYQTIVKQIQHDRVLDLYCGTGILTCSVAKFYSGVIGVDFNPAAIEDARANASKNAVTAQFECCDVIDYLDQLPSGPATVILDPPPSPGVPFLSLGRNYSKSTGPSHLRILLPGYIGA